MISSAVYSQAKILWEYMRLNQILEVADCILGLGSHDTNIAKRCAERYHENLGDYIIFSGGLGKLTKKLWNKSEAEKFAEIAISLGVPKDKIYVENNSTNTGDNFILTKNLIINNNLPFQSFIVVTKPCSERRVRAVFEKRMPQYDALYTSPKLSFEDYMQIYESGPVTQEDVISMLVGDIQRFDIYYQKGFQVYVEVPKEILEIYNTLIKLGFDKYLIK